VVSDNLEQVIEKLNNKGFIVVSEFLLSKARKSRRTAKTFFFALDKFNDHIIKRYNGKYDIQTILPVQYQCYNVTKKQDISCCESISVVSNQRGEEDTRRLVFCAQPEEPRDGI
jgi:hypothetical protein